jgi:hypothetical protein
LACTLGLSNANFFVRPGLLKHHQIFGLCRNFVNRM